MENILDEVFVLSENGVPLFSWSTKPGSDGVNLLSGFLSALNAFAKSEKGETLKELTLEQTTFIFERRPSVVFVLTTRNARAIPLLKAFLREVISRFTESFSDEIATFSGHTTPFEAFDPVLANLREEFGLDSIMEFEGNFERNDALQSFSVVLRSTGEVAYTEAKQFVDTDALGFLAPLLVKAADLVVKKMPDQGFDWLLLVTSRDRVMIVRPMKFVLFLEEYRTEFDFPKEFSSKPRVFRKFFLNPKKLPEIRYVKLFSNNGKTLEEVSREPDFLTNLDVDSTMLINTAKNFVSKYYKLELKGVALGDRNKSSLFIPFKDFFVLVRGYRSDFEDFEDILSYISVISKIK